MFCCLKVTRASGLVIASNVAIVGPRVLIPGWCTMKLYFDPIGLHFNLSIISFWVEHYLLLLYWSVSPMQNGVLLVYVVLVTFEELL